MKAPRSWFLVVLILLIAAVSLGYSLHTAARVRDLEGRLQRAEEALHSQRQALAATAAAVKRVESPQFQFIGGPMPTRPQFDGGSAIARSHPAPPNINIKPRLEPLPPYNPDK